jgi:hypothetical protein
VVSFFKVVFPDKPPIIIGTTRGFVSLAKDITIYAPHPARTYIFKISFLQLLKYIITGK